MNEYAFSKAFGHDLWFVLGKFRTVRQAMANQANQPLAWHDLFFLDVQKDNPMGLNLGRGRSCGMGATLKAFFLLGQ